MTEGVKDQAIAEPEQKALSDKEINFRNLEQARDQEKEARMRAELQSEMLRKEMDEIKELLKPKEVDPLDGDDIDPDLRNKVNARFAKERATFERKAEEIAKSTYSRIEREREEADKKNFLPKLKKKYADYDDVMSAQNLKVLEEKDPVFLRTVLLVPDEYERRKLTYKKLKTFKDETPSVKDKVKENQKNPYYIHAGAAPTSNAIGFDLNTKEARDAAYKMLKDAQRKPLSSRPK